MVLLPAAADVKGFNEEIRDASPANFLIKIESLSSLSECGIDKYESRPFEAGGCKWKLIICFEGNEGCHHVSAYFSMAETEGDSFPEGWEFNAICSFFLYNQLLDNYLCFRGTTRRFNAVKSKWGLSKLISKRDLIDPSGGYVVDDSCVFGAEVLVIKTQRVNECLSLMKDASSYKIDWMIPNFSKLENVWNSEVFDVEDHNWKVKLYPKGSSSRAKDRYMSMFVGCDSSKDFAPHQKLKAKVIMSIKSKPNDALHSKEYERWFTSSCGDWGFPEFISIADMSSKGFLVDDCLFLEVEITVQALALDAPKI